jgi:ankyrin repeat protein
MKSKIAAVLALCFCFLAIVAPAQKSKKAEADKLAEKFSDAAEKGNLDKVKSLLDAGVNIDIEPSYHQGWTALMAASTFGQTAVVKYLLSRGANAKVRLEDGETALIQAAQSREDNTEIVKDLILAGANVNAQTKKGLTALMRQAWVGQAGAVKALLDADADAKLKNENGWTAFYFACSHGNDAQIVKLLLGAGAGPNERNARGETPLMWLGWGERTENFKALIAAGTDVNARDNDGRTALMISAARFFPGEIKLLLDARADVTAKDKNGWNALMHASASRFRREEIGAHGDGFIVWLKATKIIEDLISKGTDPNAQNEDGETALMLAIKAGNAHFAETLLAIGANAGLKNKKGKTAEDYKDKKYNQKREAILRFLGRIK